MGLPQNDQLFRKYSTLFSVFGIQVQNTPDLVDFSTCGATKNRSHHVTPRESLGSVNRLKVGVSVLYAAIETDVMTGHSNMCTCALPYVGWFIFWQVLATEFELR